MSRTKITRNNPALIALCVDISGSMAEKVQYNGELQSKAAIVDRLINSFIDELLFRCRKGADFRNYFNIAVIGYNEDSAYSLLGNSENNNIIFTVPDLLNMNIKKISLSKQRIGADGRYYTHVSHLNCWIKSNPKGNTPTHTALTMLYNQTAEWIKCHESNSNTPILIHITDGEATDVEPQRLIDISQKIRNLSINNKHPLLMNVNISSFENKSIIFPSSIEEIPSINSYARNLYTMSSYLPEEFHQAINNLRSSNNAISCEQPVKAVAYNASFNELVGMMSIGTSTISK